MSQKPEKLRRVYEIAVMTESGGLLGYFSFVGLQFCQSVSEIDMLFCILQGKPIQISF